MFEKFLLNKELMTLLLWLYNHPGEVSASTIQDEVQMDSFTLVKHLHLLYTLEACEVTPDAESEELFVTTNPNSELYKILSEFQNFVDDKMNETNEIEVVLNEEIDNFKDLVNEDSTLKIEELLNVCKNDVEEEDIDITKEDIIKFLVIFHNILGLEG